MPAQHARIQSSLIHNRHWAEYADVMLVPVLEGITETRGNRYINDISKDRSSSLWEENGFCGEDDSCNGSQRLSRSLPRGQNRCHALRCEAPLRCLTGHSKHMEATRVGGAQIALRGGGGGGGLFLFF